MMNRMNMNNMMKQMKKMQKELGQEQENLKQQEFKGVSPDDMVTVTFSGDKKMTDIQIKPEAIDPDDPDMLGDLVLAAVNDGLTKVDKSTQDTMGKYTKGIPGM
ncbi:Nucleoid-associated protein [Lentilactobacillus parabuchneri]|uniref:YbaB/EbfC family nucleoid-associated protein n=1 Tax=Lentilactobacillus parabuchneri TaxID=152331 RepID=UPI000A0FE6FA|nr:YbaB/EbfC family nucleoid-associated protein [Lentilactobacillus parabuchneri]ORN07900.1 Nucleoid-associated protein [Lentilactobacillus parabuchneri]